MSRREERARKIEGWLEQLQSWKASGKPMSEYANVHGIQPWSMYYWLKVLRREGRWPEGPAEERGARRELSRSDSARVPLRFARVSLEGNARRSSVTVRVPLANGRRAEIELGDAQDLGEVLAALERWT
jgi:hypothetical protein